MLVMMMTTRPLLLLLLLLLLPPLSDTTPGIEIASIHRINEEQPNAVRAKKEQPSFPLHTFGGLDFFFGLFDTLALRFENRHADRGAPR